ncbi:MAG TPA: YetF domain-containing protein [Enterovirga sp.]
MTDVENWFGLLLGVGLESKELSVWQMGLRAIVVYLVTVIMVRLGKKRFLGRATAFDVILGIMLGSIVSRAVTGNAPMLPALVASAVLVLMHFVFSGMALRWHGFGSLIKGNPRLIVRDGAIDERNLRKAHMTEHDLHEDLRSKSVARLDQVAEAHLERSGQMSVIKAESEPKVIEVTAADGVQTIRIEIKS